MFDVTIETNNQAEGNNYAVGNPSVKYYVRQCIGASEIEILILLIFLITFLQQYFMCVNLF